MIEPCEESYSDVEGLYIKTPSVHALQCLTSGRILILVVHSEVHEQL